MSETASGLARLAALLMVTSLFAVVWNGDHQTQQRFIIARKTSADRNRQRLLAEAHPVVAPVRATPGLPAAMHSMGSSVDRCAASEAITTPGTCVVRVEVEMELPAGIANGRYQVVDQTGTTQTIRVTLADSPTTDQDLYILNADDGSRRFFIRISEVATEPLQTRTAFEPSAAVR